MGGGPRTFPGGITKWQWKRMLVKRREEKQKQRLAGSKAIFEMRQRAEVLASHPELQQPWEKLAVVPPFGISTGQQVASLVSRFNKPLRAEDPWTQQDGPQQGTTPSCLDSKPPIATPPSSGQDEHSPSGPRATCPDAETSNIESVYGEANCPPLQPLPFSTHWLTMGTPTSKKKSKDIGKSMGDYLDAFGSDPLGVTTKVLNSKSKMEVRRDPLSLSVDKKETAKNGDSSKKKPGKGGRKNRGR